MGSIPIPSSFNSANINSKSINPVSLFIFSKYVTKRFAKMRIHYSFFVNMCVRRNEVKFGYIMYIIIYPTLPMFIPDFSTHTL